jgi:hypothetical protein
MELNGVRLDISIGDLELQRTPAWWIESLRGYPMGRAGITLPDPDGDLHRSIKTGDAVSFDFGYREEESATWTGTVELVYPGDTRDQLEIRAVDEALPLTKTKVVQAWENESPEAIVAWAIRQAGLQVGRIEPTGVVIPRFVASNCPVWQMVRQVAQSCREAFGLDMDGRALWLGEDGVNWGDYDEPGYTPVIATGEGLIDHEPAGGEHAMSMIETWLLADLTHSRLVRLVDHRRSMDMTFRAQRVRHEGSPDRARTFIWY